MRGEVTELTTRTAAGTARTSAAWPRASGTTCWSTTGTAGARAAGRRTGTTTMMRTASQNQR